MASTDAFICYMYMYIYSPLSYWSYFNVKISLNNKNKNCLTDVDEGKYFFCFIAALQVLRKCLTKVLYNFQEPTQSWRILKRSKVDAYYIKFNYRLNVRTSRRRDIWLEILKYELCKINMVIKTKAYWLKFDQNPKPKNRNWPVHMLVLFNDCYFRNVWRYWNTTPSGHHLEEIGLSQWKPRSPHIYLTLLN